MDQLIERIKNLNEEDKLNLAKLLSKIEKGDLDV